MYQFYGLTANGHRPNLFTCAVAIEICLVFQSHLLGMHVLGVRNIVVITGDPPKNGSISNATGVYDVNSIGLLKIVNDFNPEEARIRTLLPEQAAFFAGTGVEPNAADLDTEIHRLELKVEQVQTS